MLILRSNLKSLSILPVPSTTLAKGSSAIETGSPVSSRIRLSRFFSSAPPPVSTMPRSLMSALNSGGVRSSATRIALTMVATHSPSASRISPSPIATVRGTPSIRLRPLISIVRGLSRGYADDDARMHQHLAPVRLLNEVIQHALGDFEVGDHAILHRLDGDNIARRAPEHLLSLFADGFDLTRILVDGDNGRLIDDDAFS